jgi:hypothetical protein
MSKKEKQKLKSQFEYECYLRGAPYYIMMKYGFCISMFFTFITCVYAFVCLYTEFFLQILFVKKFILLILFSIIFTNALIYIIGNIVFEIRFTKQFKS